MKPCRYVRVAGFIRGWRIFITAMGPCPSPTYDSTVRHQTKWCPTGERCHGSSVSLRLASFNYGNGPCPLPSIGVNFDYGSRARPPADQRLTE